MNKKIIIVLILNILLFSISTYGQELENICHIEENVIDVYDREGNYIFATAMGVVVGDQYISQDNIKYTVKEVKDKRATAEKIGKIDLLEGIVLTETKTIPPLMAEDNANKLIGLYHSHNAESYLPGEAIVEGRGEIHEVGLSVKRALEDLNVRVIQAQDMHLPHDGAAYERSRATVVDLTSEDPDALFDIHRDAIPRPEEYLTTIQGEEISQIRIVLGRQNPNLSVNDNFARQLKALADEHYPGLIKDIFYGGGSYNQELAPHALLLEFGTHVTTKEQAQASAVYFAAAVNQLLYGGNGQMLGEAAREETSRAIRNILWIILILAAGILVYLFINEGSWSGVVARIKKFISREIIDRGKS